MRGAIRAVINQFKIANRNRAIARARTNAIQALSELNASQTIDKFHFHCISCSIHVMSAPFHVHGLRPSTLCHIRPIS